MPIPRDLWIDPLKSKINALYYYGEESEDITGSELISKTLEEISGLSIDYSIVLNLNFLEEVIDTIGGITIEVKNSFTDEKFPNSDVPPDILPVELRYKTVSFEAGIQQMDGKKAIEYIRSRQSTNEDENTDNARSIRQQEVIKSIINKISSRNIFTNPKIMGEIYYQWKTNTQTSITDEYLIGIGKYLLSQEISYQTISIPVQDINQKGILYNPPIYIYKQWIYLPHDRSWRELQDFIQLNLHP
jgi:LCP family protein required for cell wall assembly